MFASGTGSFSTDLAWPEKVNLSIERPPPGGFETIKYQRSLPYRGPSGLVLLLGTVVICGYGFYKFALGAHERRELDRENAWTRIYLTPLLVAETDRDVHRRTRASVAREAAIMEHVKGWKVGSSVYHVHNKP